MSREKPSTVRVTSRLGSLALKHLKPEHVDLALSALKSHLKDLPADHPAHKGDKKAMEYCDRFFQGAAVGSPEAAAEHPPADWRDKTRSVSEQPADWRGQSADFQRSSGHRWNT